MSQEQDKVFFRNFSLIVGGLAVMMVVFIIAARMVGFDEEADMKRKEAAAAKNTTPMGEVSVAEPSQEATPEQPVAEVAATEISVADPAQETAPEQPAAEVAATDAAPAGDIGKQVYDGLCTSCHGSGIPGIPQFGDKAAWEPRIAQGKDMLYQNSIQGFTGKSGMMMPPKGGGANTDDEVKAAVDYMVSNSQ